MKKILLFILALVCTAALTACQTAIEAETTEPARTCAGAHPGKSGVI